MGLKIEMTTETSGIRNILKIPPWGHCRQLKVLNIYRAVGSINIVAAGFNPPMQPRVLMSAVGTTHIYDLYRPNRRFFTLVQFCDNGLKSVATK
jgi:hypothetical protein